MIERKRTRKCFNQSFLFAGLDVHKQWKIRMHSSRMRTAHLLTALPAVHPGGSAQTPWIQTSPGCKPPPPPDADPLWSCDL